VKEVLLGVAGIRPEMGLAEPEQPGGVDFSGPRKVKMPQRLLHPDVHRKGILPPKGKQQRTVRDLPAHARQPL